MFNNIGVGVIGECIGALLALPLSMFESLDPKSQLSPEPHCLLGTVDRGPVVLESFSSVVLRLLVHRSRVGVGC